MAGKDVCSYRDDGNLRAIIWQYTNRRGSFETIHYGHLAVHEDNVIVLLLQLLQSFFAIRG